jgi:lipid-A-disaccharide synthase
MTQSNIFLFAGEPSGDLHGSRLMHALKKENPNTVLWGVGGPQMRAQGLEYVYPTENFEMMGFSAILCGLPRLVRQFYFLCQCIKKRKPSVVILIDYPTFNIRLAQALRKRGYKGKIVQYIAPTVWAWGKGRIAKIANSADLLLTILPFEKIYFAHTNLSVKYVGHPLVETIRQHAYDPHWKEPLGIPQQAPLIALFPGSRRSEIDLNLPKMMEAVRLLKNRNPDLCFAISCSRHEFHKPIQYMAEQWGLRFNEDIFLTPPDCSYDLMRDCHSALAKSGTVTLELALHQKPTVVFYEMSHLNRWIATYLVRPNLSHYCLVNILADKEIYPEFIAKSATAQDLCDHILRIGETEAKREVCSRECKSIEDMLGNGVASEQAAKAILELCK